MALRCTREEWRAHTAAWRRTGLSAVEYARSHDLNPRTFAWWRWELRRDGDSPTHLTFVPVAVPPCRPGPIEVSLPQGIVVRVSESSDLSRVATLIRALVAPC